MCFEVDGLFPKHVLKYDLVLVTDGADPVKSYVLRSYIPASLNGRQPSEFIVGRQGNGRTCRRFGHRSLESYLGSSVSYFFLDLAVFLVAFLAAFLTFRFNFLLTLLTFLFTLAFLRVAFLAFFLVAFLDFLVALLAFFAFFLTAFLAFLTFFFTARLAFLAAFFFAAINTSSKIAMRGTRSTASNCRSVEVSLPTDETITSQSSWEFDRFVT